MKPDTTRLSQFLREQHDTFVDELVKSISEEAPSNIQSNQLVSLVQANVQYWITSLETGDPQPLFQGTLSQVSMYIDEGISIDTLMTIVNVIRQHIWQLMGKFYSAGDWDMDVVELVERWLHEVRRTIISGYNKHFEEASERLAERERAIEAQSRLIQELSVPIVPIHEGVLVLPLVGAVDSRRASQIMESALEQIVAYQADVLILDITGVPVVDTGVANYILQMARAVTLLGSKVVLVGIGAEIAQTIVQLGVELRDMTTLANLQVGIAYALAQQGYAISPMSSSAQQQRELKI